jgi:GAF domain-containing protein/HAMP domain-containing protein
LRNAKWIGPLSTIIFAAIVASMYLNGDRSRIWVAVIVFGVSFLANWQIYGNHPQTGISLLMTAIGLYFAVGPVWVSGSGITDAVLAISVLSSIGLLALSRASFGRILMWSFIAGTISILMELFGPSGRPSMVLSIRELLLAFLFLVLFVILLIRNFSSLNIRTKIVLGILATGGAALAIFSLFAISLTAQVTNSLSERLETSVTSLAQEQLLSTVNEQAELADQSFRDVLNSVQSFGDNWVSLQARKEVLSQGNYWDAATGIFEFDNGNYGNLLTEVSSLYVPPTSDLNASLIADMNASAYLDFYAPTVLEKYPSLLAIYAIDTHGITRYYPNINLAEVVPPGFDPTQRPYYVISTPLFNPKRLPRWTIPYTDATGGGLVVTVASPIYINNSFSGVVAADMQLTKITQQVAELKMGKTGYAFLIDDAGRILSMPPAGYLLFGLRPKDMLSDEFFKNSVLGIGSPELRAVTSRMAAGGSGLLTVEYGGLEYYISFAPIKSNGYSLAVVVPVQELQSTIISARRESQAQIATGTRTATIILLVLLVVSIFISLGIGQIISAPILRLTNVANDIVDGNLTAQANISSKDEIGTLADAFNTMTSRLRETLQGLEMRVEERARQLKIANERNERRARQFEAISQVAATISSTRDLNTLLNQVTTAISDRFGFYHVGIFLLDPRREYAVLSAANSEGGQRMLARQHRLRVGETGLVGFVTSTGKPRLALDTVEDAVYFNNPDLPDTHSEIALPLTVENEVIGALDVQSIVTNAFDDEDVNILVALADQVAIAIQNSRQFDETRKALAEADALSRQFIQVGWRQFTKTQNLIGVHHTGAKATLLYTNNADGNGDDGSKQEQERSRIQRGSFLSLPVKLRGEVIGSVDVRSPNHQVWDQDDLDVVAAIIERSAVAMENARLLAESQKRAAKERTIGEISARISAQSDIDELLKTAAQELNRALPGAEIAVQLNKTEDVE